MVALALGSAGLSQAAATALGDAQGVPPGHTGASYPDDTYCMFRYDGKYPLPPGVSDCRAFSPYGHGTDTIYAGVFSIDLGNGQGKSVYETRPITAAYTYQQKISEACPNGGSLVRYADDNGNNVTYSCVVSGGETWQYIGPACPNGGTFSGYYNPDFGWSDTGCFNTVNVPTTLGTPSGDISTGGVVVNPSQAMTVEWSCLPSRRVDWASCSYNTFDSHCNQSSGIFYNTALTSSVSGSGSGFSLNTGSMYGAQNITAPSLPGTYNYSLTCNGGTNAMIIPVTVNDPCPGSLESLSSNTFILRPSATNRINSQGYNFCIRNAGGYQYFVPSGSAAELQSFVNRIPALQGISVF